MHGPVSYLIGGTGRAHKGRIVNVLLFGATGTPSYRLFYSAAAPLMPLARRLFPNTIVTTEQVGKAMLNVARRGWPTPILEQRDIARASA